MTTKRGSKMKWLLRSAPRGAVLLASWLAKNGYSHDLQKAYKKSGWLKSIGTGALQFADDDVDYHGALYALQKHAGLSIHVGGRTALALHGQAQYIEFSRGRTVLMGKQNEKLPRWFTHKDWKTKIDYYTTSFLPTDMELVDFWHKGFSLKISSPLRAIMECAYLAPNTQDLAECYELMDFMYDLHAKPVQTLLENCNSIKAKRLFLYFAHKCDHPWLQQLDLTKVNLGSGVRSFVKNGVYMPQYKITLPHEFKEYEQSTF